MKFLSWMQRKINRSQKPNSFSPTHHRVQQELCKEEFSEWPDGLLAIGTFGNRPLKELDPEIRGNFQGNQSPYSQDNLQDLTLEEVGKLGKELNSLLEKQVGSNSEGELEDINLTLDKFLSRGKDVCLDSNTNNSAIGKKSVSFLLKKIFACTSGFAPPHSLTDPISESRMEKILRTMLHKKIYPQNSCPTLSRKKYLEQGQSPKCANEDEINEMAENGSKWVKTDSEYIVLEI